MLMKLMNTIINNEVPQCTEHNVWMWKGNT